MPTINFLLYAFLSYILWKKKCKVVLFISLLWTFSALMGIYYYSSDSYRVGLYDISLGPFLFLYIGFVILLIPLIKQKKEIHHVIYKKRIYIDIISWIIILICIEPFFELLYLFYDLITSGRIMLLGASYDDVSNDRAEALVQLSALGKSLSAYFRNFKIITPVLFFYNLQQEKTNAFLLIGLLCVSISPSLNNLTIGNRTELIWFLLYFSTLYLLLKNTIHPGKTKYVKIVIIAIFSVFLLFFIAITLGRYLIGHGEDSASSFLIQYTAESMYNFNTYAFHEPTPMYGHQAFNYFIDKANGTASTLGDFRNYLNVHMRSPSWIFYSIIGDFYIDFGLIGALLFIVVISLIYSNTLSGTSISLEVLLLFSIYLYAVANGLFYCCYMMSWAPAIYCIIFYLLLKLLKING